MFWADKQKTQACQAFCYVALELRARQLTSGVLSRPADRRRGRFAKADDKRCNNEFGTWRIVGAYISIAGWSVTQIMSKVICQYLSRVLLQLVGETIIVLCKWIYFVSLPKEIWKSIGWSTQIGEKHEKKKAKLTQNFEKWGYMLNIWFHTKTNWFRYEKYLCFFLTLSFWTTGTNLSGISNGNTTILLTGRAKNKEKEHLKCVWEIKLNHDKTSHIFIDWQDTR